MYEERGYQKRDIPTLILTNNLTGLDVDKRAVQLASFSLVMKARSVNNHFFDEKYYVTPHVYELQDSKILKDMGYRKQIKDLNLLNDTEIKLIDYLVDTFTEGKTIGSLLEVKPIDFACLDAALEKIHKQAVPSLFNTWFLGQGMKRMKELATLAKVLSAKYDVMITNPPYIGPSTMEAPVKDYASKNYSNSKTDMFAMFMETSFVRNNGFMAMINMHSWMFLSSYEKLRSALLSTREIITLAHLGSRAFDSIGGEVVQTTTFVFRNFNVPLFKGVYCRLVESNSESNKGKMLLSGKNRYVVTQDLFCEITGSPIAYWASSILFEDFKKGTELGKIADPKQGIIPGNVNEFLRFWHEVSIDKVGFDHQDYTDIVKFKYKWFPYNKGGEFRKWYGNYLHVINMENNGYAIKYSGKNNNYRLREPELYFKPAITWSKVCAGNFSMRYMPKGYLFDIAGCCVFNLDTKLDYVLGFTNTDVANEILKISSPTLNFEVEHIKNLPIIFDQAKVAHVEEIVKENIKISKTDWDSFETSWDFIRHPLLNGTLVINKSFTEWLSECQNRFNQLKSNEEELNRIFIDIYGLQDELTPEVEDKDVTVRLADKERDIRSLISYLIGIVMGRYSLDVDGLAYAGGDWDASKYITYQPDDDGIVPIYTKLGMQDGLTTKLIELIKLIYGEDTYRQNIDFIAEALGKNNNESSEETLNRYLNDGFYPDHLKIYQKRPIYWMFSSGKKAGFKCLIYMHRYNEDTLARINAKYYLPESTRKKNELDELNGQITKAEGRDKTRLEKERQNLAAAYNEAIEYGQVLDHMANQYIKIDLDDGVNVNYAKFQEVQLVTDSGTKVKKDLLVPLK
jgi:hypothetical protein